MNQIKKVALAGATGNLGPHILSNLLHAGFEVVVLSRKGSKSTDDLRSHPSLTVALVDYEDRSSLETALEGVDAVVSNLSAPAILLQKNLIDASIAAGVKRYIPSEFGSDLSEPEIRSLPLFATKWTIQEYLFEAITKAPQLNYTILCNGPFLDWSIAHKMIMDLPNHSITYYDGGDVQFSATTLASIGKAVAGILKNPEQTKNRTVYVQDVAVSQKELVEIAKSIDGVSWTIEQADTSEAVASALSELSKPNPDLFSAAFNQVRRVVFSAAAKPKFLQLDNQLLGVPEMTPSQLREVISRILVA